jgi:hypothetical protein
VNRFTKIAILTMSLLLLGNLLIVGAKTAVAQGIGAAIASAESKGGQPACWVAVGNKIYFVEKDDSTILKVKASGAL